MRYTILAALLCLSFLSVDANAALGPSALRTMMRNNTNTGNLNEDITNPGVNSLLGYDVNSTLGRLDGGTGAFQVFLLGAGLTYDSPSSTMAVAVDTSMVPEAGSNIYFTNARATSAVAAAYFTGSTAQYVRGDGTLATLPTSPSWTFQYPSRALNSCFQISTTQDTNFTYSVDINATLTLGGGTAVVTSYTNSGCSTGAQAIANGAVSSVALLGTSSIPLSGWIPAGKWAKVTATASGGGSAAIDAVQSEALKP